MEIYNYFLVFVLDHCTIKGSELSKLWEIKDTKEHLKGFATKRRMQDFVLEYSEGLQAYKMLKPIS